VSTLRIRIENTYPQRCTRAAGFELNFNSICFGSGSSHRLWPLLLASAVALTWPWCRECSPLATSRQQVRFSCGLTFGIMDGMAEDERASLVVASSHMRVFRFTLKQQEF